MRTISLERIRKAATAHQETNWFRKVLARLATRRALDGLSDHALRDIALTRGDIDDCTRGPISPDAATALRLRALRRAGNW